MIGANKAEDWVAKNQKGIFTMVGVIALVALAYLGYNKFIAEPKAQEAMNEMYTAQKYFDEAVAATEATKILYLTLALKWW